MSLNKKLLDYLESKLIISPGLREQIEANPQRLAREIRSMKAVEKFVPIIDEIELELKKIEENKNLTKEEEEKIIKKLEVLGYLG